MKLTCTERKDLKKKSSILRNEGILPGVCYGKGEESKNIQIDLKEFEKIYRDAGSSTIVEGEGFLSGKQFLINDVKYDPIKDVPVHVDLHIIDKNTKVSTSVNVNFINEAPAVKKGLVFIATMNEIEVEGPASKLPHEIEVDLSNLNEVGDQIAIKDLVKIPDVEFKHNETDVIASIAEAVEEVEETPEIDLDAIEVEQKGKKEEEGEGGEEGSTDEGSDEK